MRRLAERVRAEARSAGLGARTKEEAAKAAVLAKSLHAALAPLAKAEAELRRRRLERDTHGDRWDEEFTELRFAARKAERDGATGLYVSVFGRITALRKKRNRAKARSAKARPMA